MNSRHNRLISENSGFSLIELMVVVVIVSILAAFAFPAYNDHIRRSRATNALSQLSTWGTTLEQYYLDNHNYGAAGCGITAPAINHYDAACVLTNGGQGYTMTATSQASNEGTYTLSEGSQKATTAFKGAGVAKTCWLVKGSEC